MRERYEVAKSKYNNIEKINEINNSIIAKTFNDIISTYVPIVGSIAINGIDALISNAQDKKKNEFCKCVFESKELITQDMVTDIKFIMEFVKTLDVVNKLATNEKVKLLGNLFKNTFIEMENCDIDEYEEWLTRLSDLSMRELKILAFLFECESECEKSNQSDENKDVFEKAWNIFLRDGTSKFNLDKSDLKSIVQGTTRSGFCDSVVITYAGSSPKIYFITDYFIKFTKRIGD